MQITKKPDLIFKKPELRANADLSKSASREKKFPTFKYTRVFINPKPILKL